MRFSFSQLSTYKTCPRQYEFASIKKIPRQISAGESFGSSVHNTLARFGKREMESGKWKVESNQLALFSESHKANCQLPTANLLLELWHQSFIVEGYASKTDADAARKKGEKIMQHFFNWWKKQDRNVIAIESGFLWEEANEAKESKEAKDIVIRGRFDRVEKMDGGLRIIDYKTGGVRSQAEADHDLQMSIYTIAAEQVFGLPCQELTLLFLQEDGITEVCTTRSDHQLQEARDGIFTLSDGIIDRRFNPTPSPSVCKRCPYRGICDAAM